VITALVQRLLRPHAWPAMQKCAASPRLQRPQQFKLLFCVILKKHRSCVHLLPRNTVGASAACLRQSICSVRLLFLLVSRRRTQQTPQKSRRSARRRHTARAWLRPGRGYVDGAGARRAEAHMHQPCVATLQQLQCTRSVGIGTLTRTPHSSRQCTFALCLVAALVLLATASGVAGCAAAKVARSCTQPCSWLARASLQQRRGVRCMRAFTAPPPLLARWRRLQKRPSVFRLKEICSASSPTTTAAAATAAAAARLDQQQQQQQQQQRGVWFPRSLCAHEECADLRCCEHRDAGALLPDVRLLWRMDVVIWHTVLSWSVTPESPAGSPTTDAGVTPAPKERVRCTLAADALPNAASAAASSRRACASASCV
jgi:hypothetical protein